MIKNSFHKSLFITAHEFGDLSFYSTYKQLIKNQYKQYEELRQEQKTKLKVMLNYCYENVPYYHSLFNDLKIKPNDIKNIEDLQKLPILNKEIIKSNWELFKPQNLARINYYNYATGGSTGEPFNYRLSKHARFFGGALLYRGWGYGGYKLGDQMIFLAGSSLSVGSKSAISKFFHERARNVIKLSAYDMGNTEFEEYNKTMKLTKPQFLRGYASSIFLFSQWLEDHDIKPYSPSAIFTTAEKLTSDMRFKIGNVFNCEVYDGYGLNDGGVSAFECSEHSGLHIDTECAIMEIVDQNGNQIQNGKGKILATSLLNFALPFIRYDTGDIGNIIDDTCNCRRGHRLLKEIIGRDKEHLITPKGKKVHGAAFFNTLFADIIKTDKININNIIEFQVIQEKRDKIIINIRTKEKFNKKSLDEISNVITMRSEGWNVEFNYVDKIEKTAAGKFKFIINKLEDI